jgi:20S proteasome subunit beta 5
MAGGAADCAFWIRQVARATKIFEYKFFGTRLPVSAAAKQLKSFLLKYKGMGLSVGTIVAGTDRVHGGNKPSCKKKQKSSSCKKKQKSSFFQFF